MDSIEDITKYYSEISDRKLIDIANQPRGLRIEILPILQRELIKRGKTEEALSISDYLIQNKVTADFGKYSKEQLRNLVSDRLASGESLESIKLDLQDNGIDLFDFIHEDARLKEQSLNYLTELKGTGLSDEEIDQKLEETLAIDKHEIDLLKKELNAKGKRNLAIGFTCVAFLLYAISSGMELRVGAILVAGIGVWRIYVGFEQIKKQD